MGKVSLCFLCTKELKIRTVEEQVDIDSSLVVDKVQIGELFGGRVSFILEKYSSALPWDFLLESDFDTKLQR